MARRRRKRRRHVGGFLPMLKKILGTGGSKAKAGFNKLIGTDKRDRARARIYYNRVIKNYGHDPRVKIPPLKNTSKSIKPNGKYWTNTIKKMRRRRRQRGGLLPLLAGAAGLTKGYQWGKKKAIQLRRKQAYNRMVREFKSPPGL